MGDKKTSIPEKLLQIYIIFCAIALICLTIPFWIYMKYAADDSAWVAFAIYIISAIILIILAIIGIFGSIKKNQTLLLYFALVNIVMLAFGIAQLIVTAQNLKNCSNDGSNNFSFLCSKNTSGYYVPVALLLFINLTGAIASLILRWQQDKDTPGNYY
ncbi:hypothetical protein SAMD00019534_110650 [Acytostelium subglobosum LB1]|uniref:hypothetical protein n=1 Tax=Acytostelium subglobosum LB1 TaxID=1410327 RepID=UPI0006451732|nr:hypothetical protein SAMD00019534_110650 [Acytostelium subglobosum LB1]GAM27889.1 hypothetical protein SAMD00019534_110650 [Acytostelium subglobosum LB1]|eukprot:XP_012749172.1 hypothetical protein SAMD00019534_110650 [Acytostelium subglobosum LB1]